MGAASVSLDPLFPDGWLAPASPDLASHTCLPTAQSLVVTWRGVEATTPVSPVSYTITLRLLTGPDQPGAVVADVPPVLVGPDALPSSVYAAGTGALVVDKGTLTGDGVPTASWVTACVVATGGSGLARCVNPARAVP